MKKIFLLLFSFGLLFGANEFLEVYEPNEKNFRDGFEAGIRAVAFQAKTDGFTQTLIKIKKPFLLVYNITETPMHEALFLQIITAREGFDTHYTKEYISMGEFEREIDAKDAIDLLVRKYKIKSSNLKILKNIEAIVTYPFLFNEFYKKILNEVKEKGYFIQTEIKYAQPAKVTTPTPKKKVETPKPKQKNITFKNSKAMSYELIKFGIETESIDYIKVRFLNSGVAKYVFDKEITTTKGEKFIKVSGQNLYFLSADVNVK